MTEIEREIMELEREYETDVNTFHEIRTSCPDEVDLSEAVIVHHWSDETTYE